MLDTNAGGAFAASGYGTLNLAGRVVVDSSSPAALTATGNARLTAARFTVAGGISRAGSAQVFGPVTRTLAPHPLAGLFTPALGSVQTTVSVLGNSSLVITCHAS